MKLFIMQGTTLAGKTEHGRRLSSDLHLDYISSGNIARSFMDKQTEELFAEGQLSPHDEKIRNVIFERLSIGNSVLLDGFPRTALHVVHLMNFVKKLDRRPSIIVVRLDVPVDVIVKRAVGRGRDQFDTEEVALKRNEVYTTETKPALDFLGRWFGTQVTVTVPAEAEKDNVYRTLLDMLDDAGVIL